MANKTVRVLLDQGIDGRQCKCGEVVMADAGVLTPLVKAGQVDDSKHSVEYAVSEGYVVRKLSVDDAEPDVTGPNDAG